MTAIGASSINAPSASASGAISAVNASYQHMDLSLMVYALELEKADARVKESLNRVQNESKLRDIITARVNKLRDLKGTVSALKNDNEKDSVSFAKVLQKEFGKDWVSQLEKLQNRYYWLNAEGKKDLTTKVQQIKARFGVAYSQGASFSLEADGSRRVTGGKELWTKFVELPNGMTAVNLKGKVSVDTIDKEIKRLEDQLHQIDANREVRLITLNDMLNKKSNMVTQVTNLLKASHETSKAILRNLHG